MDPNIPAFQLNESGLFERHPDKCAYEFINAACKIVLQATPAYQFEPIVENRNRNTVHADDSSVINLETEQRSIQDEDTAFNIISDLFPTAIANGVGFKTFYIQVEEVYGKNLDDKLWIQFVHNVKDCALVIPIMTVVSH